MGRADFLRPSGAAPESASPGIPGGGCGVKTWAASSWSGVSAIARMPEAIAAVGGREGRAGLPVRAVLGRE